MVKIPKIYIVKVNKSLTNYYIIIYNSSKKENENGKRGNSEKYTKEFKKNK